MGVNRERIMLFAEYNNGLVNTLHVGAPIPQYDGVSINNIQADGDELELIESILHRQFDKRVVDFVQAESQCIQMIWNNIYPL